MCVMENEIFIRSHSTGRYLSARGKWSGVRSSARAFPTVADAKSCSVEAGLDNAEIVIVREGLICMRVPIDGN
jgi:hypothetical protein